MDIRNILDQVLHSAKEMAQQGKTIAEDKIGLPAEGKKRDEMLSNMGKGAAAAGLLAVLLGTKSGRSVSKTAVSLGSIAALGGLAYKTWQNWQGEKADETAVEDHPDHDKIILQAMIMAAKSDGHIDADELDRIQEQIDKLGLKSDMQNVLMSMVNQPVDPKFIADQVDTVQTTAIASEIYIVSMLVIDAGNEQEKAYLDSLQVALNLPDELVALLKKKLAEAST